MLLSGKLQADLMPMQEIRIVPMKTNCQSFAEGPSIRYRDSRLYVRHFANLQVADRQVANLQVADCQVANRQAADRQVADHQIPNH
jgi:hypothetical protein